MSEVPNLLADIDELERKNAKLREALKEIAAGLPQRHKYEDKEWLPLYAKMQACALEALNT